MTKRIIRIIIMKRMILFHKGTSRFYHSRDYGYGRSVLLTTSYQFKQSIWWGVYSLKQQKIFLRIYCSLLIQYFLAFETAESLIDFRLQVINEQIHYELLLKKLISCISQDFYYYFLAIMSKSSVLFIFSLFNYRSIDDIQSRRARSPLKSKTGVIMTGELPSAKAVAIFMSSDQLYKEFFPDFTTIEQSQILAQCSLLRIIYSFEYMLQRQQIIPIKNTNTTLTCTNNCSIAHPCSEDSQLPSVVLATRVKKEVYLFIFQIKLPLKFMQIEAADSTTAINIILMRIEYKLLKRIRAGPCEARFSQGSHMEQLERLECEQVLIYLYLRACARVPLL